MITLIPEKLDYIIVAVFIGLYIAAIAILLIGVASF
jgi:hypothetical protein